jgi:hypothetical protein
MQNINSELKWKTCIPFDWNLIGTRFKLDWKIKMHQNATQKAIRQVKG